MFFSPPDVEFWNFERRGIFYYLCCILACVNVIQLAVHFRRVTTKKSTKFFANDEVYLKTPFGMCSVLWNNGVNFIIYLMIIFGIDNYSSVRNIAMYWCGAMMTSELVIGFALFSGPSSHKIQYSSLSDAFYVIVCAIVLTNYLVLNPRIIVVPKVLPKKGMCDFVIVILLLFSIGFNFFRCLGGLNSSQYHIKLYRVFYEPYMVHPSQYSLIWILFSGMFGIPCEILAIYYLYKVEHEKALNTALLYAGSTLQGTSVYLSYNMYTNSQKLYRLSPHRLRTVYLCNALLVLGAHLFLLRCLCLIPTKCTTLKNCVHLKRDKKYCSDLDEDFSDRCLSKYDINVLQHRPLDISCTSLNDEDFDLTPLQWRRLAKRLLQETVVT